MISMALVLLATCELVGWAVCSHSLQAVSTCGDTWFGSSITTRVPFLSFGVLGCSKAEISSSWKNVVFAIHNKASKAVLFTSIQGMGAI